MILAADIGGTNSRVALFEPGGHTPIAVETYRSHAWSGADELLRDFLARHPASLTAACIAVAGPVQDGKSRPVNLSWGLDERRLALALDVPTVALVNDLEANAHGIAVLEPAELAVVNAGEPEAVGNRAVVSAGTGLGEAGLWWDGSRHRAVAGEGGHADFAPRTELEVELYRYLAADYGRVSYERVCSGGGIVNIYRFLRDRRRGSKSVDASAPSPAAISADAAANPSGISAQAVDLFLSIYGARAANVALAFLATGGVYLGGGIAPRMVERLEDGPFMRAFTDKGRLSSLLARIPVSVVLDDRTALRGAAQIAAEHDLPAAIRRIA